MSDDTENTPAKKRRGAPDYVLWKPGQSGNPDGRPKGARSKFSQDFVIAFADDFAEHGRKVIRTVRENDPSTYLRTACVILPKIIELDDETMDAIKDLAKAMPFDAIRYRSQIESEKPTTTH